MVWLLEHLNMTLKSMLHKHAVMFGNQWDHYLPGVLWAHRNTPHEATKEKPSYLLIGTDCRFLTKAAFLPTEPKEHIGAGIEGAVGANALTQKIVWGHCPHTLPSSCYKYIQYFYIVRFVNSYQQFSPISVETTFA